MAGGPDSINKAIEKGIDLDGSPISKKMLDLYKKVQDLEATRKRHKATDCMRTRIVRSAHNYFPKDKLDELLKEAGWDLLSQKEIDFFFSK